MVVRSDCQTLRYNFIISRENSEPVFFCGAAEVNFWHTAKKGRPDGTDKGNEHMNPLEIYKLLPKLNCGECTPKTCMSFAVSLGGNPGSLAQCRHIKQENLDAIKSLLAQGEWKDKLIKSLMDEVSKLGLEEIAPDLGCCMRDDTLVVRCIGQEYSMGGDGTISPDTKNKWINILLLHYVRNRGKGEFTGKWVSFSELKGGFIKSTSFLRECEEPLRELMDQDPKGISSMVARLGAAPAQGFPADHAWTMDLLPKVRALFLYRAGDEEFPSSMKILFDSITGQFLDVESLMFVCEGLIHTLRMMRRG